MIELNRSSKTKTRKAFISIALVLALAITGALAFLTARDSAENKFTVGNVDIDLTEPNWDENAAKNIVSGQVIAKDPTITNTGRNDAYVYMMVEIPKAIETDIVSTDESGNEVTTTEANYPLFSFAANEGWTLIDSQVGTDIDAYDYYVYGYNTALTPGNAATLFNEVAFANVTSDFVDTYAGENDDLSLDINVTGYAIQSDYYNNEATDATTAWRLYINQNDWTWPNKKYPGLSTLSFVAESGEVVHTEAAAVGTPVEMYFEPSLAKDGYTFDWVDETTSEVAYSGMPMPEEDTTLTASYTATGFSAEASDYLNYVIYQDADGNPYASVESADSTHANYPTAPTAVIVPNFIDVTKTGTNLTSPQAANVGAITEALQSLSDGSFAIPVKEINSTNLDLYNVMETIVVGDNVTTIRSLPMSVSGSYNSGNEVCKNAILPYGLTKIGNQAFLKFSTLETIDLPNSLTYMGDMAFKNCTALTTIDMPKGVEFSQTNGAQFEGCTSLSSVTIASDIPKKCFYGCTVLNNVTITNDVAIIGSSAFVNCSSMETLEIPDSVTTLGQGAFNGCTALSGLTIGNGITDIPSNAFAKCTSLTKIIIPDNVTSVSNSAFGCPNAEYVSIGNGLTYIPNCAKASGVKKVVLGTGITQIPDATFMGLTNLQSVTLSESVTSIGTYAFQGCSSLVNINITDNITNIGPYAFGDCTSLANITIGNGVTCIDDGTFENCSSLTNIEIPNSVTNINSYAFNLCSNLATASVPSTCAVASNAFPSTCSVTYR